MNKWLGNLFDINSLMIRSFSLSVSVTLPYEGLGSNQTDVARCTYRSTLPLCSIFFLISMAAANLAPACSAACNATTSSLTLPSYHNTWCYTMYAQELGCYLVLQLTMGTKTVPQVSNDVFVIDTENIGDPVAL